jgi:hypothetical protein
MRAVILSSEERTNIGLLFSQDNTSYHLLTFIFVMYKNIIFPICFLVLPFMGIAQKDPDKPLFPMGLPSEPDLLYETFDIKAKLTNDNYRDVGGSASVKKWAPTPKSQGQYGTCAAWATGFCARTILEAQKNGWTDKTEIDKNVFAYGFIYRVTSNNPSCWGAFTSECVKNMKEIGIPKLSEYSVHCPSSIPKEIYTYATKYKIKGYAKLWDEWDKTTGKQKVDLMKKSLSEGNPVVISMICPNSFHYPNGDVWIPKESAKDNPNNPHGRHAMCVVGYDDEKHGGAFEIQNSWGETWGNKGYIWVKYEDFAAFVYQAMELIHFDTNLNQNTEVVLSGAVRYVRDDKMEMKANLVSNKTYKMDMAYKSGTRFRLYISNNEPAFVYAFGSDLTNRTYQVFPYAPNVSPALTYKQNDVPIPSEDKHIRMDGTVGTDYLCVLYSKDPLDLEAIRQRIEAAGSRYTFRQKVEMAIGPKLMKDSEITYTKNAGKMSFTAKAKGKSCVAMIVEMEHVD